MIVHNRAHSEFFKIWGDTVSKIPDALRRGPEDTKEVWLLERVISLDSYLIKEWYPGFRAEDFYYQEPFVNVPKLLRKEDESACWSLDFHWPRGFSPMQMTFAMDCWPFISQFTCQVLDLPPTKGVRGRFLGTHLYLSQIDVTSPYELGERAQRFMTKIPNYIGNFNSIWDARKVELDRSLAYFEDRDLSKEESLQALGNLLVDARTFQRRAWDIHFEMMYPSLAVYLVFYQVCQELGIAPGEISKFLQGYDTKILETDRELWRITSLARQHDLQGLFERTDAPDLRAALDAEPRAAAWLKEFDQFLKVYGRRTEGIADVMLPSWQENQTSPLGTIKTFLLKPADFDFTAARKAAIAERDEAVEAARSQAGKFNGGVQKFDAALKDATGCNFAWWNDEHNYWIDLRASLPIREVCLEAGKRLVAEGKLNNADDTLFMFYHELTAALADPGKANWRNYKVLAASRRAYYDAWRNIRPEMPPVIGQIPEQVSDPVMIEIFGMHHNFLKAVEEAEAGGSFDKLVGVPASTGVVEGIARVLHTAEDLHTILPGEILVCEATSPNWTPAFAKIAACVCDGGGTLTHASIISREYRIPCVVGTALATRTIKTGMKIRVDGTQGIVYVFPDGEPQD